MKSKTQINIERGNMKMEKTNYLVILTIFGVLLGLCLGYVLCFATSTPKTEIQEVPVNHTVYQDRIVEVQTNHTVEVPVADASLFLDQALADLKDEFGDDDDFLTCGGHEFDEDEVSISRVNTWTLESEKNGDYTVYAQAKLKFADNSDERDCKKDIKFEVFYEEDEQPDVAWSG